jgi:hypothetical protein
MGYRKMAKDNEGNAYVKERSVPIGGGADAVMRVVEFTAAKRTNAAGAVVVYWPSATYEVYEPASDGAQPVGDLPKILRHASGAYDVPSSAPGGPAFKALRVSVTDAVKIALGKMPPAIITFTGATGTVRPPARQRDEVHVSTAPTARPGPQVIPEPEENRAFRQGDRILRQLALYPEGVDAQTMSAGLHQISATAIRKHLNRVMRENGPVRLVKAGVYRAVPPGQDSES